MPVGIARRNDHHVGYIGQPSYIQHLHVDSFHIVERGRYDVLQRGCALWLRRAARACASYHAFKWCLLTGVGWLVTVLPLTGSIAPRLADNIPDFVGNEILRIPSGNNQITQLGRGNLELRHGVYIDATARSLMQVTD